LRDNDVLLFFPFEWASAKRFDAPRNEFSWDGNSQSDARNSINIDPQIASRCKDRTIPPLEGNFTVRIDSMEQDRPFGRFLWIGIPKRNHVTYPPPGFLQPLLTFYKLKPHRVLWQQFFRGFLADAYRLGKNGPFDSSMEP
jgi:hypothetical protein